MNERENETKNRRENFSISLRKRSNDDAFVQSRRRVLESEKVYSPTSNAETRARCRRLFEQLSQASDEETLLFALVAVRELVSSVSAPQFVPCAEALSEGLIEPLFAFARDGLPDSPQSERARTEAIWAVSNLAGAGREQVAELFDRGLLEVVEACLRRPRAACARHALWALSNVTGDDPSVPRRLADYGLVPLLIQAIELNVEQPQFVEVGAWLLSNLLKQRRALDAAVEAELLDLLLRLLPRAETESAVHEVLWGLCFFVEGESDASERARALGALGLEGVLLARLQSRSPRILLPTLRLLGYLAYCEEATVRPLVSPVLFQRISEIFTSSNWRCCVDALWLASNLALTAPDIQSALCTAENVNAILALVADAPAAVQRQSLETLAAFSAHLTDAQLETLIAKCDAVDFLLGQLAGDEWRAPGFLRRIVALLHRWLNVGEERRCARALIASPRLANVEPLLKAKDPRLCDAAEAFLAELQQF